MTPPNKDIINRLEDERKPNVSQTNRQVFAEPHRPVVHQNQERRDKSVPTLDVEKEVNSFGYRQELGRELRKSLPYAPYSPEVNEAVKELKEKAKQEFGTIAGPDEVKAFEMKEARERHWAEKNEIHDIQKDGVTSSEVAAIKRKGVIRNAVENMVEWIKNKK